MIYIQMTRWIDLFVVLFSFMIRYIYISEYNHIKNVETFETLPFFPSCVSRKKKKKSGKMSVWCLWWLWHLFLPPSSKCSCIFLTYKMSIKQKFIFFLTCQFIFCYLVKLAQHNFPQYCSTQARGNQLYSVILLMNTSTYLPSLLLCSLHRSV